ncbi:glycosyltransferase [Micrococcus luteus]|uniref:glycosyltransferase family 4 protein n=1 Tax=Micrococcus luteus TaxID=1270 RepID=UPI00301923BA|nr:glycosyltransferase [Micrococcus luteus]
MSAQDRAGRGRPETVPEPSGGEGVRHVVFACRSTALAGGITTVVDELATEFVRRGLTVSYLSIHPPAGEPRVPGPVFEVDRFRHWTADHPLAADHPGPLGAKLAVKTVLTPLWRRWRSRRLRRHLARFGGDTAIVFANPDTLTCLSEASHVRPEADAPFLVAHVHTSPEGLERMGWDVPFPALDVVDAVVALHPSYMQPIADTQGVPVGAIPNPSGTVPAAAPREDADGRRRIVSFGRLSAEKRVDLTIRAFDALAADVPDVVLEVWGTGDQEESLARLADEAAHRDRIRFCGWSDDPAAVFTGATLHLMVSDFEGLPMSAIEALRCGVPTAGRPVSAGLSDILYQCGLPLPSADPSKIADALQALLDSPDRLAGLVEACGRVGADFEPSIVADVWLDLFSARDITAIPHARPRAATAAS